MPQYQGVWSLQSAAQLQSRQQWATDPQFDNTVLLLQADNAANAAQNNTFLDSSANALTITRTGNPTQGTFTPFSATGWSNYFDGTGDYLIVATNVAANFGTGDFTVEFWWCPASLATDQGFLGGSTGAYDFCWRTTTGFNIGRINTAFDNTFAFTPVVGTWYHVAYCRSGTSLRVFVNGSQIGSTATNSLSYNTSTGSTVIGGSTTIDRLLTGNISNMRLLKGTALYTTNFTPPTSPLTAITNTSLLTCQSNRFIDNSSNAFVVTANGNASVQAFAPFAPQFQYTPTVIGGSGYFDGTGDYLTVPDSTTLEAFTDFTIEFWLYYNSTAGTQVVVDKGWNNTTIAPYVIFSTAGNLVAYASTVGSTWDILSGASFGTLVAGQWYHIALTRSGSTIRLFTNGALITTVTNGSTIGVNTSALGIGGGPAAGVNPLNGYLSSLRIVKGTAIYTAAFTPPTAPLTAVANTQLLTNFTNAAILDGTMKNDFETVNQTQISTSVVKYGTGSIAFDGTDDYVVAPYSSLFNFGTGQFTIECWVNFTALTSNRLIFDTYTAASAGGGYQLFWRSTGTSIAFYANGVVVAQSSFTTHATGVWYHIAVTRDTSNVVRIFIDGTQYASATYATAIDMATTGKVAVGIQLTTLTNDLAGYVDDFRVTKGVARYTANFTPPQVALPRQ